MYEEQYKYFVAIYEEGSLSKAAEKLYISQPALSKYLNRLEKELNTTLVYRNSTPVKLTETGKIYYEYLRKAIDLYSEMKKSIENENLNAKTIYFGIASELSEYFLRDVLKMALNINKNFDFRIIEETSLNMIKRLKNNDVSIAFLCTDNLNDQYIDYTAVKRDAVYLVCGRKNSLLKGRITKFINGNDVYIFSKTEVEELFFYSMGENYKITNFVKNELKKYEISLRNIQYISDIDSILYLVSETNRFAFFSEFYLEEKNSFNDIALCCIDEIELNWYIAIASLKNKKLSEQETRWLKDMKKFYS